MSDKHRRADFDGITTGWGGDDADKVFEKTRAWVHARAKQEAETP